MFLLILDSLGSTELLFILVMALIFFGPRKLPQLSRSLGKNIAEFRKASEDFKRTWEREVALEDSQANTGLDSQTLSEDNSILGSESRPDALEKLRIEPEPAKHVETSPADEPELSQAQHKRDWL